MRSALRLTTQVQPEDKVQFEDGRLLEGQSVEGIVLLPPLQTVPRRSIVDILADAQRHLDFQTADDVTNYLREEHDAWGR